MMNGYVPMHQWHFDANTNTQRLFAGCDENITHNLEYYFYTVFPTFYLPTIIQLTNDRIACNNNPC